MEAILAKALEYTLKYWLKSYSRDQFKLQGRTVQLCNLDINGDAMHASAGFPPALNVTTAKVGKLEIMLPSLSNVQIEPIVVQIDRLDLVLEENPDLDASPKASNGHSLASSAKGSGYGFADKIADGMTIEIHTVNLMLETRGGTRGKGGATWASPLASITIRSLLLYTTNENWQVVNLKEARDFSNRGKYIYVFKKLEWASLSVDLLPHPDMFIEAALVRDQAGANQRDDDGAKRAFFGGERFVEGIAGQAYITIQRTELNSPLGLEVQVHITEAVCPTLSEPGLRALLRFLTGLYVCLNRDVDSKAHQRSTEAAGRSLVSMVVDHIFLGIKDAEFQLELLMQSLLFSRASISEGESDNNLTRVMVGGFFLRDTFLHPPCTLVQPAMQAGRENAVHIPDFGKGFFPPIYPLGEQTWQIVEGTPLICLHSLQIKPSPMPPSLATQTAIECQPLMIHLQEQSCLRISSFLADGIIVNRSAVLPDFSVDSFVFTLKGLDLTVPGDKGKLDSAPCKMGSVDQGSFVGARLNIESLLFSQSPSLKLSLLNLEKDPACFCLWEGQPIDASQKKWSAKASRLSLSLEMHTGTIGRQNSLGWTAGLWRCVELIDACFEVAMVTADGNPLLDVPPPGGIVRAGVACQQYLSNTSVEQLFFVLNLYSYLGKISEKISLARKSNQHKNVRDGPFSRSLIDKAPSDTAVSLAVKDLQLKFLESSSMTIEGMPLVQFIGYDLFIRANHRTLGGAISVSSSVHWQCVEIDCVDADRNLSHENGACSSLTENGTIMRGNVYPQLRAVLWVHNKQKHLCSGKILAAPFLDIRMAQVIPLNEQDMDSHSLNVSASISGVRLGGGMNYTEAILHRFGILGPDGYPGKGLLKGLENLQDGPLSKLFKTPLIVDNIKEDRSPGDGKESKFLHLGKPNDVDVAMELKDWLFALEGPQEMADTCWFSNNEIVSREERCWHSSFHKLGVNAKSGPKNIQNGKGRSSKTLQYPINMVTVDVEGLQTLKPQEGKKLTSSTLLANGIKETVDTVAGIDVEFQLLHSEEDADDEIANWQVENLKFSVKQPIEAFVTKDELQHLAFLCKSEIDSLGRITAGILRLLKLEGSVGQAAMDQLSSLGSEGIERFFSTEKHSRDDSSGNVGLPSLSNAITNSPHKNNNSTLALLEEAVADSQSKLAALVNDLGAADSSVQHLATVKAISQKIESMQDLLMRLRTQL